MTLTVIDGDFPQQYLRENNLEFARYDMPERLNSPEYYTRRPGGPEVWVERQGGKGWLPW